MPAPHLSVQLSKFEQIEILRSEIEARQEELKKEVAGHPVINEALRIFGGAITDIREV